jgi:DNA modification methylase
MKALPDGCVDAVITDPPYSFGMGSSTSASSKNGGWGDFINGAVFYSVVLSEFRRVSRLATWIFGPWRGFPVLSKASFDVGWPIESQLVWDKGPEVGMGGLRGLRAQYETVALFAQPLFQIADRSAKDIINIPWGGSAPRTNHPAEKPLALLEQIAVWTNGDTILDPFCGSGTTLVAAKKLGRHFLGFEISHDYCEIARRRLAEIDAQPNLFEPKAEQLTL